MDKELSARGFPAKMVDLSWMCQRPHDDQILEVVQADLCTSETVAERKKMNKFTRKKQISLGIAGS